MNEIKIHFGMSFLQISSQKNYGHDCFPSSEYCNFNNEIIIHSLNR